MSQGVDIGVVPVEEGFEVKGLPVSARLDNARSTNCGRLRFVPDGHAAVARAARYPIVREGQYVLDVLLMCWYQLSLKRIVGHGQRCNMKVELKHETPDDITTTAAAGRGVCLTTATLAGYLHLGATAPMRAETTMVQDAIPE